MTNNNPNVKAHSVSIIMNNPKMRKMIQDAINAPVGSTRREIAKNALESVHKANTKYMGGGSQDGQGGPGASGWLPDLWGGVTNAAGAVAGAVGNAYNDVSNWATNTAAPAIVKTGVGALTTPGSALEWTASRAIRPAGTDPVSWNQTGSAKLGQAADTALGVPPQGQPKAIMLKGISKNATPLPGSPAAASSGNGAATYSAAATNQNPFSFAFVAPKDTGATAINKTVNDPTVPAGSGTAITPEDAAKIGANVNTGDTSGTSGTGTGTGTNPLSTDVSLQLGAAGTILDIRSDAKKWAATFPGVPYPGGATLAGQQEKLYDTMKQQYGLDTEKQALLDKQMQGATIEQDLQTYVHGKDTYVAQVDDMIDQNLNLMATTDMSDPNVRTRMGNYMNYLYTVKGRQLSSYSDYVTKSVAQYNAEVKNMSDKYDQDYQNFQQDYSLKAAVNSEDFKNYNDAITSMYNNLDGMADKQNQSHILANQSTLSDLDVVKNSQDALNTSNGVNAKSMTVSDQTLYYAALGLDADGRKLSNTNPETGKSLNPLEVHPNPDLYGNIASFNQKGLDGTTFKGYFMNNITPDISSGVFDGKMDSSISFYNKTIEDIQNYQTQGQVSATTAQADIQSVKLAMAAGVSQGLNDYLTYIPKDSTTLNRITTLQGALSSLTGKSWFGIGGQNYGITAKDRANFITSNSKSGGSSQGLDPSLLGIIFDTYATAISKGSTTPQQFYDQRVSSDQSTMVHNIYRDVAAAYGLL